MGREKEGEVKGRKRGGQQNLPVSLKLKNFSGTTRGSAHVMITTAGGRSVEATICGKLGAVGRCFWYSLVHERRQL